MEYMSNRDSITCEWVTNLDISTKDPDLWQIQGLLVIWHCQIYEQTVRFVSIHKRFTKNILSLWSFYLTGKLAFSQAMFTNWNASGDSLEFEKYFV